MLSMVVNLFTCPVLADLDRGLVSVLDNKFTEQQARGHTMRPHNVLCAANVCTILDSEHCNVLDVEAFRNRLLFIAGLSIGLRTSELHMLLGSKFKREKADQRGAISLPSNCRMPTWSVKKQNRWHSRGKAGTAAHPYFWHHALWRTLECVRIHHGVPPVPLRSLPHIRTLLLIYLKM